MHVTYTSIHVAYTSIHAAYTSMDARHTSMHAAHTFMHAAYTFMHATYAFMQARYTFMHATYTFMHAAYTPCMFTRYTLARMQLRFNAYMRAAGPCMPASNILEHACCIYMHAFYVHLQNAHACIHLQHTQVYIH